MIKNYIKQLYKSVKLNYLNSIEFDVPSIYHSSFVHYGGGCEVQYIYKNFLNRRCGKQKILIVGVMGGRDYYFLKNLGHDIVARDIGPQSDINPIDYYNIEDELPYNDECFDVVIIGEVLEHLKKDICALNNIYRILKPEGNLIVSLPFFNDIEEGHMRIHSKKSGERLLKMTGFKILDYLERPGFLWPPFLNIFNHILNIFYYIFLRKSFYNITNNLFGRFEWTCGHVSHFSFIRRFSKHYGGYYFCSKCEIELDYLTINQKLYTSNIP